MVTRLSQGEDTPSGVWERRKKRRRSRWQRIRKRVIALVWHPTVLLTLAGVIAVLLISYLLTH